MPETVQITAPCKRCNGIGRLPGTTVACSACAGTGKQRREESIHDFVERVQRVMREKNGK